MISRFNRYHVSCVSCSGTTTKTYARANGGRCKACVTGVPRKGRSREDISREGEGWYGYEDTMGVSPEAMEPYGGDY